MQLKYQTNISVVAFKWHVTEVTCYLFTVIWHIPSTNLGVNRLYPGIFHYSQPVSFIFRMTNHVTPSPTVIFPALTHTQREWTAKKKIWCQLREPNCEVNFQMCKPGCKFAPAQTKCKCEARVYVCKFTSSVCYVNAQQIFTRMQI